MFPIFKQFDHCHQVNEVAVISNDFVEISLIIRTSGGRLHLLPDVGKILLADATLIEDPSSDSERDDEGK